MFIALVSVGANALFDALFAHFLQSQGIAVATSLVYLVSSILLLVLLSRRVGNLQLWRLPDEFLAFFARARRKESQRTGGSAGTRLDDFLTGGGWRQGLLCVGIMLPVWV